MNLRGPILVIVALALAGCATGPAKNMNLAVEREEVTVLPTISSVTVQPATIDLAGPDPTITVRMSADPGLIGSFDVAGLGSNQRMREKSPGEYEGTFTIPKDAFAPGQSRAVSITGKVEHGPSKVTNTMAAPVALQVTWPAPKVAVEGGEGGADGTAAVGRTCAESVRNALAQTLIAFDFDEAELHDESRRTLDGIAGQLKENPACRSLAVEGHTDVVGTAEYNQRLSLRRAQVVAEYLAGQGVGVEFRVEGYGAGQPLVDGRSREANARNRRVVLKVE